MGVFSKLGWTCSVAWLVGCGPSLATVHEGTVRFEHCYRVDLEQRVTPAQREGCWRSWVGSYTIGQPRDRIEYAERRLKSLASGDASPPELSLGADHPQETRQFYLVVPAPTSVHAPPPPIAKPLSETEPDAGANAGAPNERQAKTLDAPPPPGSPCTKRCQTSWSACDESCQGAGSAACAKCKSAYSKCMRSCFD